LQDYILHEKMAHFNRERLRKGGTQRFRRFGTFTVTHDISKYTKAKMFSEIGKETKVFLRFSTVGGEKGCGNRERFWFKVLYGRREWDLVGNNTPVFFFKGKKFRDFSYLKGSSHNMKSQR
jgi:catalase